MKAFLFLYSTLSSVISVLTVATIEKIDVKILDPSKGTCKVIVNPGPPRSVDIEVESFIEAKDITLKFGAFSFIDGVYNEFIESESVKVCDFAKSENPLVIFVYTEMKKSGNLTNACPVQVAHYSLNKFSIEESEMPIPIPKGKFKVELNGTLHEKDKDTPVFISDIYFSETDPILINPT